MEIRTRILSSLGVCVIVALFPLAAAAQDELATATAEFPRLRASDRRLTALIDEAMTGSRTFKNLVVALGTTDGVVFVEQGRCPRGVRACLTWRVTLAGRYRFLFVLIDTQRRSADVVASIGHELQHALEVLAEPSLRSPGAIYLFYTRRASPEYLRAMETAAAEVTGNAVFRELRHYRSGSQK